MKRILLICSVLLMAFVVNLHAQDRTVSGQITSDEDGSGLPGVNVILKGTTTGTTSDIDGNYKLSVPQDGGTLVFSFIGLASQEVEIGSRSTIDVAMSADVKQLVEVIVTAQGITRGKEALGYSVTEVKSDQLEQRAEGDIGRVLNGKSAGVQITQQNGLSGSGTNVIIRGQSSFSSSNQALFIVDGVPFNTSTNSSGRQGDRNDFVNGNNGSSRFLDLDPNSIESVNVLKGLAAATLYGSQGRNGVILITTKGGAAGRSKKKTEVTVSASTFVNQIASAPEYQDQYGNGFDQNFGWFFSNWGPGFFEDGPAGWGNQAAITEVNGQPTLTHPYSTSTAAIQAAFPEFQGARYPWVPYSSVDDFFRDGSTQNISLNVAGSTADGNGSYNINYGFLEDEGFTPGNGLQRHTLGIGGSANLTNGLKVNGTMNFARTDFVSPPVALSQGNGATGTGSSVFGHLWFTPRSIDVQGLPFQDPITGGSVYYRQNNSIQHPLWTVANAGFQQLTNRVFGQTSASYDINDNLNVSYRVGIDQFSESNSNFQNRGGISGDIRLNSGFYDTWTNNNSIYDHNLALTGNYQLGGGAGLSFNVGATSRREVNDQNGTSSAGQSVFGVLRHFNFATQVPIQLFTERNILGLYAQAEFAYNSYLYVTVAGRNDWVSNFSPDNRSLFYPSVSVSFLPQQVFSNFGESLGINFLKIRLGYGTSANFGDVGYPVAQQLALDVRDAQTSAGQNIISNEITLDLGNSDLKPELLTETEVGIEASAWDNRISLDLSLYQRVTQDLIIQRPLDPAATGRIRTRTNIGEIKMRGIEFDLGVDIFPSSSPDELGWNAGLNFTAYENEVTDLGLDTDLVVYTGFSNLGNTAIVGEPLGVIFGGRATRTAAGELLVGANGFYIDDPQDGVIGDPNPDFIANFTTGLTYKNFNFNALVQWTQGGDISSATISTLMGRGLITETIDREATFVLPGVRQNGTSADGSPIYVPNDIQINNSDYYFSNVLFGPSELQIYDGTVIRLQEVSLGYTFPKSMLEKTPFGSVSLTASGYNLWFDAINTPDGANFDPNTSGTGVGNGFGFDFLNGPASRRYGLSLQAKF